MARKRERFFGAFGALLFLTTSSALTIAAGVALWQQHKQPKANDGAASIAAAATNKNLETKVDDQNQQTVNGKLTGAKLAGFTPTSTPLTQLQYQDTKVGTGEEVKAGATVTADYVGALMSNGTIFDASADHGGPISFPLSGVIAGWSQGIPGMKVGGTRRLLIPSGLGYGSQGTQGIPPNSDLVFDVTITKAQ